MALPVATGGAQHIFFSRTRPRSGRSAVPSAVNRFGLFVSLIGSPSNNFVIKRLRRCLPQRQICSSRSASPSVVHETTMKLIVALRLLVGDISVGNSLRPSEAVSVRFPCTYTCCLTHLPSSTGLAAFDDVPQKLPQRRRQSRCSGPAPHPREHARPIGGTELPSPADELRDFLAQSRTGLWDGVGDAASQKADGGRPHRDRDLLQDDVPDSHFLAPCVMRSFDFRQQLVGSPRQLRTRRERPCTARIRMGESVGDACQRAARPSGAPLPAGQDTDREERTRPFATRPSVSAQWKAMETILPRPSHCATRRERVCLSTGASDLADSLFVVGVRREERTELLASNLTVSLSSNALYLLPTCWRLGSHP